MKGPRTHWHSFRGPPCGAASVEQTLQLDEVTCQRCLRSAAWRSAWERQQILDAALKAGVHGPRGPAPAFDLDTIRHSVLAHLVEEHSLSRGRGDRLEGIMSLIERWGMIRYEAGFEEGFEQGDAAALERCDG